jgi:glutamate--cysteine ligase
MPGPRPTFGIADARRLAEECFRPPPRPPSEPPGERIGLELEWLTISARRPDERLDLDDLRDAAAGDPLPRGGRVSFEPGGQLELDTPPHVGLATACSATAADAAELSARLERVGVGLVPIGLDAVRAPRRVLRTDRYDAMEAAFDAAGPHGRRMMCNTAALQVNLDLGADPTRRWRLGHAVGPVLVACFANSPFGAAGGVGRPAGWVANRLATWWSIDPTRTAAPALGADPAATWLHYTLAAGVLMIQGTEGFVPVRRPLTFGQWMVEGHELGWPTTEDFAYHLTTLFPPVRPRGWFEFRMLDALDDETWPVALAMLVALLTDDEASDAAERATTGTLDLWQAAAQVGLAHPRLADAADACLTATLAALPRLGAPPALIERVHQFGEEYVSVRRCPADDRLAEWHTAGHLLPSGSATAPEPAWSGR